MPITDLTDAPRSYIKLGQIRKGDKDAEGKPRDLDYFRVTFMNHPKKIEIERAFRAAYGDRPTSLNVKFAFPTVREVYDANYECYKQGGLYFKAGSSAEKGLYWIFYRDPDTSDVEISNGMARTNAGTAIMSRPLDLNKSLYTTLDKRNQPVEHFFAPVGRLEVVIPEVAEVAVGYFEFRPESPRDIRNIAVELGTYEFMASQFGKSLLGIPFKLFRREETVPKKIGTKLSAGPSWVVHIEASAEWGSKALEVIEQMSLPEIVEGETIEMLGPGDITPATIAKEQDIAAAPAPVVVEKPVEEPMIDVRGQWAVDYTRSEWNITASQAVEAIVKKFGTVSKVKKSDFLAMFLPPEVNQ